MTEKRTTNAGAPVAERVARRFALMFQTGGAVRDHICGNARKP